MANTPRFKVYTADGRYVAALKYADDAGAIVSLYGDGATIRDGHSKRAIVWTEGPDGDGDAGNSYDLVADVVYTRLGLKTRDALR